MLASVFFHLRRNKLNQFSFKLSLMIIAFVPHKTVFNSSRQIHFSLKKSSSTYFSQLSTSTRCLKIIKKSHITLRAKRATFTLIWTKVHQKCQKWLILGKFWNSKLAIKQFFQTGIGPKLVKNAKIFDDFQTLWFACLSNLRISIEIVSQMKSPFHIYLSKSRSSNNVVKKMLEI